MFCLAGPVKRCVERLHRARQSLAVPYMNRGRVGKDMQRSFERRPSRAMRVQVCCHADNFGRRSIGAHDFLGFVGTDSVFIRTHSVSSQTRSAGHVYD
jgi:hypothetical protein